MLTQQSQLMLKNHPNIQIGFFSYPNGRIYLVRKEGWFYRIVDDGTGNGFYNAGRPEVFAKSIEDLAGLCIENDYDFDEIKKVLLKGEDELKAFDTMVNDMC